MLQNATLQTLLSKGKYSTKYLPFPKLQVHTCEIEWIPPCKKQRILVNGNTPPRCGSPIHMRSIPDYRHRNSGWHLDSSDPILYCYDVQSYGWLSINRPPGLPFLTNNTLILHSINHVQIDSLSGVKYQKSNLLSAMTPITINGTPYIAVDIFLGQQPHNATTSNRNTYDTIPHHMDVLDHIWTQVSPVVLILRNTKRWSRDSFTIASDCWNTWKHVLR